MPRRAAYALVGAALALALLFLTWYAAFHTGFGERADRSILHGFWGLNRPRSSAVASFVAHLCDPRKFVFLAAIPVVLTLLRRRPRLTFVVGAILLGANVTTQLLKPLLAVSRTPTVPGRSAHAAAVVGSWPSGHATAAMSLALVLVIAAPLALRPLVAAIGAGFAVAISYSFLSLGWHYPSDVLGGFLVAGAWTLIGVAAVSIAGGREQAGYRHPIPHYVKVEEELEPVAIGIICALALAALIALARPDAVLAYARGHVAFIAGAAAIAALGLVLATGIMALVAGFDVRLKRGR